MFIKYAEALVIGNIAQPIPSLSLAPADVCVTGTYTQCSRAESYQGNPFTVLLGNIAHYLTYQPSVLDEHRRPNLASQALGAALRRLSFDYERRWGHPVVLVETFTDPARHLGTCYKAANFTQLGRTSGYGRKARPFHSRTRKAATCGFVTRLAYFA